MKPVCRTLRFLILILILFFIFFCLSVDPGIPRTDPRFIGAWWISFIVVGALLLVATLPMFLFPAQFKTASVQAKEVQRKIKEGGGNYFSTGEKDSKFILKPNLFSPDNRKPGRLQADRHQSACDVLPLRQLLPPLRPLGLHLLQVEVH